ncbi:DEAD/DEAH box helicase family protein [Streptomyces sp. NPDC001536]|uniref:DEAD/DEAH box helicase family protein n=1 Tax=Streptomyces sp. NPDC001536 TaxID=3364583 RepID=UPI0036B1AEE1
MQNRIINALASVFETKRARRPWREELHPRDSKGRFIETGGIARIWGGGFARVVRALSQTKVQISDLNGSNPRPIQTSRLTMVARPDGTAPTKSKEKVQAEEERRDADPRRGDGVDADDNGDPDSSDAPHDTDDEGEPIGEDDEEEPKDDVEPKKAPRFTSLVTARNHLESGTKDPRWKRPPRTHNGVHLRGASKQERAQVRLDTYSATRGMDFARTSQLSSDGNFLVTRHGNGKWDVYHVGSGTIMTHQAGFRSKPDALHFANELEEARDERDRPFNWDAPYVADRLGMADGRDGIDAAIARGRDHDSPRDDSERQDQAQPKPEVEQPQLGDDGQEEEQSAGQGEPTDDEQQDTPEQQEGDGGRLATVAQVLDHWRTNPDVPRVRETYNERQQREAVARQRADLVMDPQVVDGFLIGKLDVRGKERWTVFHTGTSVPIAILPSDQGKPDAIARAHTYRDYRDDNGQPFNWDSDGIGERLASPAGKRMRETTSGRTSHEPGRHENDVPDDATELASFPGYRMARGEDGTNVYGPDGKRIATGQSVFDRNTRRSAYVGDMDNRHVSGRTETEFAVNAARQHTLAAQPDGQKDPIWIQYSPSRALVHGVDRDDPDMHKRMRKAGFVWSGGAQAYVTTANTRPVTRALAVDTLVRGFADDGRQIEVRRDEDRLRAPNAPHDPASAGVPEDAPHVDVPEASADRDQGDEPNTLEVTAPTDVDEQQQDAPGTASETDESGDEPDAPYGDEGKTYVQAKDEIAALQGEWNGTSLARDLANGQDRPLTAELNTGFRRLAATTGIRQRVQASRELQRSAEAILATLDDEPGRDPYGKGRPVLEAIRDRAGRHGQRLDATLKSRRDNKKERPAKPAAAPATPGADNQSAPDTTTTGDNSSGSEQARADRQEALGDVPASGVRGAGDGGGEGDLLRDSRDAGESGDHDPDAADSEGSDKREVRGPGGGQDAGNAASPRTGDGRADLPAGRARDGERRASGSRQAVAAPSFRPKSQKDLAPSGEKARARANVAAVTTLRQIQAENRPATPEEQKILARWSGWGALPIVLADKPEPTDGAFRDADGNPDPAKYARALKKWESFATERATVRELLNDEEWNAAKANTLNAHYTDSEFVQPLWHLVRELGFNGGNVLEPGSGSGNFIGAAPENARMTGIELDPTTAAISQLLYPDARIINDSFGDVRMPNGHFDMAIGNVPFGRFPMYDEQVNPDLKHSIHDTFILKSLKKVRPGGLVALVTSRYTMDGEDETARRQMSYMADLVGAVRLPAGAHQDAAGTGVVTDILVFRRRFDDEHTHNIDMSWVRSSKTNVNGHEIAVNDYFQQNPRNILGELTTGHGQFSDHDLTVIGDKNTTGPALKAALERIRSSSFGGQREGRMRYVPEINAVERNLELAGEKHEGSVVILSDGRFTQVEDGAVVPLDVHPTQQEQLRKLVGLRDLTNRLLRLEGSTRETGETDQMRAVRRELNEAYDAYVAQHGPIDKPGQTRFFSPQEAKDRAKAEGLKDVPAAWKQPAAMQLFEDDPASAVVFGLDKWDDTAKSAKKADIFTQRVLAPREIADRADSPEQAIALAQELDGGELHLPTIARLLGRTDLVALREEIGPLAFDEPGTNRLVSRGEYLSGNVREKLALAEAAASADPRFGANVAALKNVIPRDLDPSEIKVKMGAPWIPETDITAFLQHILGTKNVRAEHGGGSVWEVEGPRTGIAATSDWGTKAKPAPDVAKALLEQRTITVTRTTEVGGKKVTVTDDDATSEAQAKAKEMADRFSEWVWENPERSQRLARVYNDKFNNLVMREFDDSPLALPGANAEWTMRPHQNAAIRRIVSEKSVLLAHVVGAGKTATMVAGTQELRRTGLARKPAIVVPNHMLGQFRREYLELYPDAKLLTASSADLTGKKRRRFVAKAATGEWDAVILTQGAFERIPMRVEAQEAYMRQELDKLSAAIENAKARSGQSLTLKRLQETLKRNEEKLKQKLATKKDQGAVSFEDTGIDYLMVDEAHGYKNLATASHIEGAAIAGSARASDLHMKIEYLREHNESGRVVTLATGTPIANSVTEAYIMQRFLRPDILEAAGVDDFDSWAATFGEIVQNLELAPDGSGFRMKARFARFHNAAELLRMYRLAVDVQTAKDLNLPTPKVREGADGKRGEVVTVPISAEQKAFVTALPNQEWVRKQGGVLKAIGLASRAAIDMRLVGGDGEEGGKIAAAVGKIAEIYAENKDRVYPVSDEDLTPQKLPGSLQIVFMDAGTPGSTAKNAWDAYAHMKEELVAAGVPANKVRFIHEAKTDKAKAKLFEDARNGRIAVLIGSTEKMGTGTNIQARAVALHHMDFPWRPADMAQREGRIERQGNLNMPGIPGTADDVRIISYVTEETFDAFKLGTLERKAGFIAQMDRKDFDAREMEDIGDIAVSFGQMKAIATGDMTVMDYAQAGADVVDLQRLDRSWHRDQDTRRRTVQAADGIIADLAAVLPAWRDALDRREDVTGDNFRIRLGDNEFDQRADVYDELAQKVRDAARNMRLQDGARVPLGWLGGHDFHAEIGHDQFGNRVVKLRFDWPNWEHPAEPDTRGVYTPSQLDDASGRGLLASLERRLANLDDAIADAEQSLEVAQDERARAKRGLGGTSPYGERLRSKERRVALLSNLITANEKLKAYKGREVDPNDEGYLKAQQRVAELKSDLGIEDRREEEIDEVAAAAALNAVNDSVTLDAEDVERELAELRPEGAARTPRAWSGTSTVNERGESSRTGAAGTVTLDRDQVDEDLQDIRPAGGGTGSGGSSEPPNGQGPEVPQGDDGDETPEPPVGADSPRAMSPEALQAEIVALIEHEMTHGPLTGAAKTRLTTLEAEKDRRAGKRPEREPAKKPAPQRSGPGGNWADLTRDQVEGEGGEDDGLFSTPAAPAGPSTAADPNNPLDRPDDVFGTPDMFADAEGRDTSDLQDAELRRADQLQQGDRFTDADGRTHTVAEPPNKTGRGRVRVVTQEGTELFYRPADEFRLGGPEQDANTPAPDEQQAPAPRADDSETAAPAAPEPVDSEENPSTADRNESPSPAEPSPGAGTGSAAHQWKLNDWAVTPNGEGRVILAEDGEVIVLDGGGAPRTYEPRQLSLPGETRTAEHDAPTAQEAARQEKRQRDLESAQSPEGLKLFYGARLASLDLEEGHGLVLDDDGNVLGWIRRRGNTWLGQDARGGLSRRGSKESAADPLLAPREAAQEVDAGRNDDGDMPVPLKDKSWRHLRPEEGNDPVWYSDFSEAQREEFFRLVKEWEKSSDSELSEAAKRWSYGLNYRQMRRLADEFTAVANDADTSTPEGRRRQGVLKRTADKLHGQAERAWFGWQSVPPPGETDIPRDLDPDWVPYGHRGTAGEQSGAEPASVELDAQQVRNDLAGLNGDASNPPSNSGGHRWGAGDAVITPGGERGTLVRPPLGSAAMVRLDDGGYESHPLAVLTPVGPASEEPTGLPDDLDSQWRALADLAPDAPALITARGNLRQAAEALAAGDQEAASDNLGTAARSMWPFHGGDSSDWDAAERAFSIAADHAAARLIPLREGERLATYGELKKGDIVRQPGSEEYHRVNEDARSRGRDFETWFEYGAVVSEDGLGGGFGFMPTAHSMIVADENSPAVGEYIAGEERKLADERAKKEQVAAEREARRQEAARARNDELLAQAEGDAVEPGALSKGDRITVHEGRNNRGQVVTVSGRLLAEPETGTATRDGKRVPSWRLYVGEEGDELRPGTMYTIERGERVARHSDTTPASAVPGEGGQTQPDVDTSDDFAALRSRYGGDMVPASDIKRGDWVHTVSADPAYNEPMHMVGRVIGVTPVLSNGQVRIEVESHVTLSGKDAVRTEFAMFHATTMVERLPEGNPGREDSSDLERRIKDADEQRLAAKVRVPAGWQAVDGDRVEPRAGDRFRIALRRGTLQDRKYMNVTVERPAEREGYWRVKGQPRSFHPSDIVAIPEGAEVPYRDDNAPETGKPNADALEPADRFYTDVPDWANDLGDDVWLDKPKKSTAPRNIYVNGNIEGLLSKHNKSKGGKYYWWRPSSHRLTSEKRFDTPEEAARDFAREMRERGLPSLSVPQDNDAAGREERDDSGDANDQAQDREDEREANEADSDRENRDNRDRDGAPDETSGDEDSGAPDSDMGRDDEDDDGTLEGDAEEEADDRDGRRRRRNRRDRNRPGGGGPGRPRLPHIPERDNRGLQDDDDSSDLDELRGAYRSGRNLPASMDTPEHRDFLRRLADNPTLTQSAGGGLVMWTDDHEALAEGQPALWYFAHARTGAGFGGAGNTAVSAYSAVRARELANRYERLVDADGTPFSWNGDLDAAAVRGWRDGQGRNLVEAMRAVRDSFEADEVREERSALPEDLSILSDLELESFPHQGFNAEDWGRYAAEMDLRFPPADQLRDVLPLEPPATEEEREAENKAMDEALGFGELDVAQEIVRPKRLSKDQQLRDEYQVWHEERRNRADNAMRGGSMLNKEGQRKGYTEDDVFNGGFLSANDAWRRYASEELVEWFDQNGGRVTYNQFREQKRQSERLDRWEWEEQQRTASGESGADSPAVAEDTDVDEPEVEADTFDASKPRFNDIAALREHLRAGELDRPGPRGNWDMRQRLDEVIASKKLEMSPGGRLAIGPFKHSNRRGLQWRILAPGSMETLFDPSGVSRAEAVAYTEALEGVRDRDGNPFPWDAPDAPARARAFRGPDGENFAVAVAKAFMDKFDEEDRIYERTRARLLLDDEDQLDVYYPAWRQRQEQDGYTIPVYGPFDVQVGDDVATVEAEPFGDVRIERGIIADEHPAFLTRTSVGGGTDFPLGVLGDYTADTKHDGDSGRYDLNGNKVDNLYGFGKPLTLVDDPVRARAMRRPRPGEVAPEPATGRDEDTSVPATSQTPEAVPTSDVVVPEERPAPEPIGGRIAEWVSVSDLALGDVVRIEGTTRAGKPRALSGYVIQAPQRKAVSRKGRSTEMFMTLVSETRDGSSGDRSPVWTPLDASAARATGEPDNERADNSLVTGAEGDVLSGEISDRIAADVSGRGMFPGSLVQNDDGRDGVVTGANSSTVSVRWGDDKEESGLAPSSLTVTDGGAARPAGWTPEGQRLRDGHVVSDPAGTLLGTVEEIDGDTAQVATREGIKPIPVTDLRAVGEVRDTTPPDLIGDATLDPTTVGDLNVGDTFLRDTLENGPRAVTVLSREDDGDRVRLDLANVRTGEVEHLDTTADHPVVRLVGQDGQALPAADEDDVDLSVLEEPQSVDPVIGDTVDPQLSPEERDAIADHGAAPADDPGVQQAVTRIGQDLPVTSGQAAGLADALRATSTPDTADGRAARRAAAHLDEAVGRTGGDSDARPTQGTVNDLGVGDTIALPDEDDANNVSAYTVIGIDDLLGGVRQVTVRDSAGATHSRTLPGDQPLWQLPELPDAEGADAPRRDPNPAPSADDIVAGHPNRVARAVVDSAIAGTEPAGSIHQLRQQVAERVTSETLLVPMQQARQDAVDALNAAGISGPERSQVFKRLKAERLRARAAAVRAVLRTINDLEPLDGESEQDTANRAADLLRMIPDQIGAPAARRDGTGETGESIARHVDDALMALARQAFGDGLSDEDAMRLGRVLAGRMDATRQATAQRIVRHLPPATQQRVLPQVLALLMRIGRRIVAMVQALLRAARQAWNSEAFRRFRERLVARVRSWPESRRLHRIAQAADLPVPGDGEGLGERIAHWARLMPAPGRFGQASRRSRWYQPTTRRALAAGELPAVQDGMRWAPDRAADRGPGATAMRHLAALRAAGVDMDQEINARLAGALPDLGDDPHTNLRLAAAYADTTERRARDLAAHPVGHSVNPDYVLELAAARAEAADARVQADRMRAAYTTALPDVVADALASVREMGPGGSSALIVSPGSDSDAARALNDVQRFIPRDWLAPTDRRLVHARDAESGGYEPHSRTVSVADLGDGGLGTAAYALLAHLQQAQPDLLAAQEVYRYARTHTGRIAARRSSVDELFARLFSNSESGRADVVLPRALLSLFNGDWYEDDDLRAFLLGLLATR